VNIPTEYKMFATTAAMSAMYHAYGEPDVILGVIPLYNAQMIEVTKSHQELKYRSIQGQFLAHQRGGNYALRIDVKLPYTDDYYNIIDNPLNDKTVLQAFARPPTSLDILTLIQMMHIIGDKVEIDNINSGVFNMGNNLVQNALKGESFKNAVLDGEIELKGEYTSVKAEWHRTFPILIKEEILFNMFIETMVYWRTVKNDDPNTINLSILCRKFLEPPEIIDIVPKKIEYLKDINVVEINKSENVTGLGSAKIVRTIDGTVPREIIEDKDRYIVNQYKKNNIASAWSPTVYTVRNKDRTANDYEVLELLMNTIYRTTNIALNFNSDNIYRQMLSNNKMSEIIKNTEKVINVTTGKTETINFESIVEIDSITFDDNNEGTDAGKYFHASLHKMIAGSRVVKLTYRNMLSKQYTYYIADGNYYKAEINKINYLFLVIENGVRIWRDEF